MDHGNWSKILKMLKKMAPYSELLTGEEELYIYSHYGVFGSKRLEKVVGVIRHPEHLDKVTRVRLEKDFNLCLLSNRSLDNWDKLVGGKLIIILDEKELLDPLVLREAILENEKESQERISRLLEDQPFMQWLVNRMKVEPGYRLSTSGYCITQGLYDGLETFSSKGRLLLSKGLLGGELEFSNTVMDSLYTCTTCGQCFDEVKGEGFEINKSIIRARNEFVKAKGCPETLTKPAANILRVNNPMGLPSEDKPLWYEEAVEEHPYQDNQLLYWAGCTASYRLPKMVESAVGIMGELGLDFGLLGKDESCCGLLLYLSGYWKEAEAYAVEIVENLKKVSCLVTGCAGCYYMFNTVYRELGIIPPFKVMHMSQLLEKNMREEKLGRVEGEGRFLWHDPCDLGRHSGVFDPPRNVLRSIIGLELVEPPLTRRHSQCCGGGGGLMAYDFGLAEKLAYSKVINDVEPLLVDGVVTGCPACIINLQSQLKDKKVLDISQLVYDSMF